MELITVKRIPGKNPKEMLLELFANDKEPFIVMMSNDWFNEFSKCDGVLKDSYELNPVDYNAYFIKENGNYELKIEVKFVEYSYMIVRHSNQSWNRKPAKKIYYFE